MPVLVWRPTTILNGQYPTLQQRGKIQAKQRPASISSPFLKYAQYVRSTGQITEYTVNWDDDTELLVLCRRVIPLPSTTAPLNETTSISPSATNQRTNPKYIPRQNHPSSTTTIPSQSPEYPYLHTQDIKPTRWMQQMSTLTVYIHLSHPPSHNPPTPTHITHAAHWHKARHTRPSTTCTRIHT
jgi:hypothetical protein